MPAIKPIAIKDGAATPATRTYRPIRIDGDVASFVDRDAANALGNATLTVALKPGTKASPVTRAVVSLEIPSLAPATPGSTVEVVDYSNRVNVEFIMAKKGSRLSRTNLRSLIISALLNDDVILVVDDQENLY